MDQSDQSSPPPRPTYRQAGPPRPDDERPGIPAPPVFEMSVEQARRLDSLAVSRFGIPSIVLMENAAIALCGHAIGMLAGARSHDILIVAGPGNNGGDGFALARHLANRGLSPRVVITQPIDRYTHDAAINLSIITKMDIPILDARAPLADQSGAAPGLVVDALFGTGLARPITGVAASLLHRINRLRARGARVVAIDVPSGLDAQSGSPLSGTVVTADRTVTLAALKLGLRTIDAQPYAGEIFVEPIGIPLSLLRELGRPVTQPQDRS